MTECGKTIGNLLHVVATKLPDSLHGRTKLLTDFILSEKIVKPLQLDEAIVYLKHFAQTNGGEAEIDLDTFAKACGVGATVSDEEIHIFVDKLLEENKEQIA